MTEQRLDARWVVPVEPAGALPWHSVVIRQDRIVAVLPTDQAASAYPGADIVDLREHALLPGLVNAHTHAAMTLLRGWADDLRLMDWLQQRIWPAETRWVDEAFVADGTLLGCVEMALGGTTTYNDMYFHASEAVRETVAAGLRIVSGLLYLGTPTRYAASEGEYIERGLAVAEAWRGHDLVRFALAPHSTYATSDVSWERAAQLAADLGVGIHTHVNETRSEVQEHRERQGASVVEWLAGCGVLSPGFVGAHGVHMTDREIELLAETGASIAHCPSSNLKLASGFAPVARMLTAGVNVAIGTDGAASNNRLDMWQEMRTAALLAKGVCHDGRAVTAQQALAMATINGARALGLGDELGTIVPGKKADLVSVDLSSPLAQPHFDPVSHLVYVASRADVRNVWVDGAAVVRNGRCVTTDVDDLLTRVAAWGDRLGASRHGPASD